MVALVLETLKKLSAQSTFLCLIMSEGIPFSVELHQRTKDVHDASDKLINVKLVIALTDTAVYGSVLKVQLGFNRALIKGLTRKMPCSEAASMLI